MGALLPKRALVVSLLAGAACTGDSPVPKVPAPRDDVAVRFLPAGEANLLLPYDVTVDAAHRRAWVTSLSTARLAEVDLDTGALVKVHTVTTPEQPALAQATADGDGDVWISGGSNAPITRLDVTTGLFYAVDALRRCDNVVALPTGGAMAVGADDAGDSLLVRFDGDGAIVASRKLDDVGIAIGLAENATAVAVNLNVGPDIEARIDVIGIDDLETRASCLAPFVGNHVNETASGAFALVRNTDVALVDCAADTYVGRTVGTENKEAVAVGDDLVVLDRIGTEETDGPNWGIGRTFDAALEESAPPFATGKNSGFGDVDAQTGFVWMNSEGTTETIAVDPATGAIVQRVRLGVHLESLVGDPDLPATVWVAGRLSGTLARVDLAAGERVDVDADLGWPTSPLLVDGTLYVLDQLSQTLWTVDPTAMTATGSASLGLGPNTSLNFDVLAWSEARGTLFVTAAQVNRVLEVSPAGEVLGTWQLPGDGTVGPDSQGVLDVRVVGDAVVTYRTIDGTLARLDPATGDVTSVSLPRERTLTVAYDTLPHALRAADDGSVVWVGGYAYDAVSLAEVPDRDLPIDRVLGEADGGVLGYRAADEAIVFVAADGGVTELGALVSSEFGEPTPLWLPGWSRVAYFREADAEVRATAVKLP